MKHDLSSPNGFGGERSPSVGLLCCENVGSGNSKFRCSRASLQLRHLRSRFRSYIMPALKYSLAFRRVKVVKIMLNVNFIFPNPKRRPIQRPLSYQRGHSVFRHVDQGSRDREK